PRIGGFARVCRRTSRCYRRSRPRQTDAALEPAPDRRQRLGTGGCAKARRLRPRRRARSTALRLGWSSADGRPPRLLSYVSCRRRSQLPPSSRRFVLQSIPAWRQKDRRSPACLKSLVDEGSGERAREPDPEHDRETPNLVFQGHSLANQLLARDDQRAERMSLQRLHMHGLEEPGASQMRQASRVIAVGLVGGERLERLVGLSALDADHRETKLVQPVKKDRRHASCLEHDPTTTRRFRQFVGDRLRTRLSLALANHHPFAVEN